MGSVLRRHRSARKAVRLARLLCELEPRTPAARVQPARRLLVTARR